MKMSRMSELAGIPKKKVKINKDKDNAKMNLNESFVETPSMPFKSSDPVLKNLIKFVKENEDTDNDDRIYRLEEILLQFKDLLNEAEGLLKKTNVYDSARSYWIANIKMSLDDEHSYLGRGGFTFKDTIDALQSESEESEESEEEFQADSEDPYEKLGENKLFEKAPPGFEGTVKAMKKHKDIDNPYALAWHQYKQGNKSHRSKSGKKK